MFYGLNLEEIKKVLDVNEKKAKMFLANGTHSICEKYLKRNPGDTIGALNSLKEYIIKRKINNNYSVEKYVRLGMTIEEAELKIAELKLKTSGSLNSFISRYGEIDGKLKYEEFCRKSAHTEETFKRKYGEDWQEKWLEYKKQKESRSDEYFKKKRGEDWEAEKKKFIDNWAHQMTEEGMILRYGEKEGKQKYHSMTKRKQNTVENSILLYGEDEGIRRFLESNEKRGYANTLQYFVEKYGLDLGTQKYYEKQKKLSTQLESMIERYGLEEGSKKYHEMCKGRKGRYTIEWYVSKYGEEEGKNKFKAHYANSKGYSGQQVQKSQVKFFELLQSRLSKFDCNLIFGQSKSEKHLFRDNGRRYFYDAVDEDNKIIFEFNGSAFHYHSSFGESWVSPYGMTIYESVLKDEEKMKLAVNNGYRYCIIWDFEIDSKDKIDSKIESIKRDFYENCTRKNVV